MVLRLDMTMHEDLQASGKFFVGVELLFADVC